MPDFGDDEYLQMICIESGNVADNALTLPPGATTTMQILLNSRPGV
jgi:D-hexose-6-phosphate mutarotase